MARSYTPYLIEGLSSDGALLQDPTMNPAHRVGYISVLFYSDSTFTTVVQPTTGTLTFEASEDGERFGTIPSGTLDASLTQYDRPNFAGAVKFVRATAAGIDVATHYRATIHRFGDG